MPRSQTSEAAKRRRRQKPLGKAAIKRTLAGYAPALMSLLAAGFVTGWRVYLGVFSWNDPSLLALLLCPVVMFLLLTLADLFHDIATVLVCLGSLWMSCCLAWNLDRMVALTTRDLSNALLDTFNASDTAPAVVDRVIALATDGHPMSSTLTLHFLMINLAVTALVLNWQHNDALHCTNPGGNHCGGHVLWAVVNPIGNQLVFVMMMLASSNTFNRTLWITLTALIAILGCHRSLSLRKVYLQVMFQQRELTITKSAQQHADSVLNHVLKNLMVDVSGCLELCSSSRDPGLLSEARALLVRGMWWCRMREGILGIVSDRYTAAISAVSLAEFATGFGRARSKVACAGSRVMVFLDELVCNIILDNAVSNAVRHGCPDDPQVSALAVSSGVLQWPFHWCWGVMCAVHKFSRFDPQRHGARFVGDQGDMVTVKRLASLYHWPGFSCEQLCIVHW